MGCFDLVCLIHLTGGDCVRISYFGRGGFETHVIHGGHRGRTGVATDVLAQVGPTTRAHHYDYKGV